MIGLAILELHLVDLQAEVVRASDDAMETRAAVSTGVTPEETFRRLLDVARWWDPAHTWGGDSTALSLEAVPNGCFCEKLPTGGVRHASVLYIDFGRLLRLSGALGPLQQFPLTGILDFTVEPQAGGSRIELTYRVAGHIEGGLTSLAPVVDGVLTGQLTRLGRFVDTGQPE
jgi:hypothetical protein